MPRYYFHFGDGKRTFTDAHGVELSGLAAVRNETCRQIRDMKAAQLESGCHARWSEWAVSVEDQQGRCVLTMGFDMTPRPVG